MIRARKRFGQHFLEPAWVAKVVAAIAPQADETFVEIGPGGGALTRPLLERAKAVVAFEIDRDLAAALRAPVDPRLTVVEGDFLESTWFDEPAARALGPLRVAGNLPYNVAAPIIFSLIALHGQGVHFSDATLMLQREVADRLLARPGTHEYGVLSVLVGHRAAVTRVLALPPGAFRPAPNVHSSLLRLRFHAPDPRPVDALVFERLVRAVFTRRRKTLANALLAFAGAADLPPARALALAGVDPVRRPETLSLAEFVRLADVFSTPRPTTPEAVV